MDSGFDFGTISTKFWLESTWIIATKNFLDIHLLQLVVY